MEEFSLLFEGVTDLRRSNATRHSLHAMLMIALFSVLCGGVAPGVPAHQHIRTVLLCRVAGLFFRVMPWRTRKRCIDP